MGPLVMVVDKHDDTRALESALLAQAGYQPVEARSGRQALSLLEDVTPCAVIVDFLMGDMDGVEVVRAMRAHERLRDVPALIVSAAPFEAVANRLAALDVDAPVVSKPVDPDHLIEAVRAVSDRS
jgi:CheY-like chemotaxis protein